MIVDFLYPEIIPNQCNGRILSFNESDGMDLKIKYIKIMVVCKKKCLPSLEVHDRLRLSGVGCVLNGL